MARAAESKAGPRLAEVAGRARRSRESFGFAGLEGMFDVPESSFGILSGKVPAKGFGKLKLFSMWRRDAATTAAETAALQEPILLLGLLQRANYRVQRGVQNDGRTAQCIQPGARCFVGRALE